jgi:ATP-dependent metalloprotease
MAAASDLTLNQPQNWGYSEKIGPVYLNDQEERISASKREEIEGEVRRYELICSMVFLLPI